MRSIIAFVLAVVTAVLLWATLASSPAHADPTANWSGDSIVYDNHGYNLDKEFKDPTGTVPSGATVYKTPVQTDTAGGTTSQKVFILYFSPGVDPPTATTVKFIEFDYKSGVISNPANAQDVGLTLKGEEAPLSSCSVEGVGWLVCPISVFLAGAMDNLFNILATMIAVQPPILGDPNNSLYMAWNVTRGIANIAFVIVFLIIIYAQLTHTWVTNYGLKRLLPRLIVAAILVNISFYIAAAAIDISNILGYSVQDVFNGIRESLFRMTNDTSTETMTDTTWTTVAGVVLAGGGVIGGLYYMASGGLYLLISLLVGIVLIALFVVIILAARQAIILILVIIAPLAFVANLLPNTEKWFEKWKDLFMTMLIFFPAFSLVFGGSQLAGQLIIQNAGDNIVMLLFGLAVQVAPLVITPLILKLSGGLLGRIAQIANDPRKGIHDRTKNWANARAEHAKHQNISRGARWYNPASYGSGLVRGADFRKRRLSDNTDVWKQRATNRYNETRGYGRIHERMADAETQKEAIHSEHAAHVEHLKRVPGTALHASAQRAVIGKELHEREQNDLNAYYNRQRTIGTSALSQSMRALEYSKLQLETSDNDKNIYLTQERMRVGSTLHGAVDRFESSKLHLEGSQQRYTAMVDAMKLDPTNALYLAAQTAQSGKDHAEAAQNRVQALFDSQRQTEDGNGLNAAFQELISSKVIAERGQADVTKYAADLKNVKGSLLHWQTVKAEEAKLAAQVSEAQFARIIEEYKSGAIDPTTLTVQEQAIMQQMSEDSTLLSAEKQGTVAAQYEIQRNISDAMTGAGPLTDSLLDIAQSVGGEAARVRARAQAVATKNKLDSEALGAGVELLKDEARIAGSTIKRYSAGLVNAVEQGLTEYGGQDITPERLKAALQAQADEKNMSLFERVRGNRNFDQSLVSEVIANNVPIFKGAGGFHLQENPDLNIERYATEDEFNAAMRFARVQSLANASANGLSGVKFGWLGEFADPVELNSNIQAALAQPDGEKYLRMAYTNVREALNNPDIRATIGDREDEIRAIETALAQRFGQQPSRDDRPPIQP